MKKSTLIIFAVFLGVLLVHPAFAGLDKVEEKLNRGATNMVAFWLEIPYQMVEGIKKNPATGLPVGLGMAIIMMPARIGSGLVDIMTCPVPFPVEDYGALLKPEYNPWIEQ